MLVCILHLTTAIRLRACCRCRCRCCRCCCRRDVVRAAGRIGRTAGRVRTAGIMVRGVEADTQQVPTVPRDHGHTTITGATDGRSVGRARIHPDGRTGGRTQTKEAEGGKHVRAHTQWRTDGATATKRITATRCYGSGGCTGTHWTRPADHHARQQHAHCCARHSFDDGRRHPHWNGNSSTATCTLCRWTATKGGQRCSCSCCSRHHRRCDQRQPGCAFPLRPSERPSDFEPRCCSYCSRGAAPTQTSGTSIGRQRHSFRCAHAADRDSPCACGHGHDRRCWLAAARSNH